MLLNCTYTLVTGNTINQDSDGTTRICELPTPSGLWRSCAPDITNVELPIGIPYSTAEGTNVFTSIHVFL